MTPQEEFISLMDKVHRKGAFDFVRWLINDTDYLDAPASTKYHGADMLATYLDE